MVDRLKEIPAKILAWWNKYTAKQKTIIIAIATTAVFAFVILVYVLSRPQYTKLGTYASAAESAKVVEVLDDAGVTHRESADALTIEVVTNQLYKASLALGSAGIVSDRLKYSEFVDSSMSTTSSDKEKQWQLYLQAQLENTLEAQSTVRNATVILDIPPQNGTLIASQEETSAFITLELEGNLSSSQAAGLAKCVQTAIGNSTTANITILDTDANLLFAGGDEYSSAGIASSMQELQNQAEAMIANQLKRVLYGTKQYDLVEVTSHLDMDYSEYQETKKEYYANADRTEGMKAHEDIYESSSTNDGGGVPGTDSNDGSATTTYVNPDASSSESSQTERSTDYLPNEYAWNKSTMAGIINYDGSSMAISMITYRKYYEKTVKSQGLLDGISWDEYKEANGKDVMLSVADEYYKMAANATGISEDKITIIAYESPIFYDAEGLNISVTDVTSIVTIIIILAFLAFAVLRGMNTKREVPEEEEISVETILQSTPETPLDDIDVETKSETRKLVEKFVDENPESAANLLRNWLNEDWG